MWQTLHKLSKLCVEVHIKLTMSLIQDSSLLLAKRVYTVFDFEFWLNDLWTFVVGELTAKETPLYNCNVIDEQGLKWWNNFTELHYFTCGLKRKKTLMAKFNQKKGFIDLQIEWNKCLRNVSECHQNKISSSAALTHLDLQFWKYWNVC